MRKSWLFVGGIVCGVTALSLWMDGDPMSGRIWLASATVLVWMAAAIS